MLVLLESMRGGGFDAHRFADMWRTFFADYGGYFDQATKTTLANMDAGKDLTDSASDSDDLAGASRLAALVPVYHDNLEQLVSAARAQTRITHNNDGVLSSADFFARSVLAVLGGQAPQAAMQATLDAHFSGNSIEPLVSMGLESRDRDTRETIAEFGQMCSVAAGLPGAVHLICRYAEDFKSAMVENVMAGGDSSARGMMAGMVLGAVHGLKAIPAAWQAGMTEGRHIDTLLDHL
jgi:ADP-ribosylglycohydrolase